MTTTATVAVSATTRARRGIASALHLADTLGIDPRNLTVYLDTWLADIGSVDVDVRLGVYDLAPDDVDRIADDQQWPAVGHIGSNFYSRAGMFDVDGLRLRVELIGNRPPLVRDA